MGRATSDLEQDDLASVIHHRLYTDDVDTAGIVYTSSRFNRAGEIALTRYHRAIITVV